MSEVPPKKNSLVLYKRRPALVAGISDKIEIQLEDGETKRVRPKDIDLLHEGPIESLAELGPSAGETASAWELLAGQSTTLEELSELVFGEYSPRTAWAAWQLVSEGTFFEGEPGSIRARSSEEVEAQKKAREAVLAEEKARKDLIDRIRGRKLLPEDRKSLREIEAVARGKNSKSALLRDLELPESPSSAHMLLLKTGYWDDTVNPYPSRYDISLENPKAELPSLAEEERRDLTGLPAFAIDDEGNQDPDDAISWDGKRVWVHIADVAALIRPGSPVDIEARSIGANLYLPDQIVHMLPRRVTDLLGLGLNEISPALSFAIELNDEADVIGVEIVPSLVKVTRLSYADVDRRLEEEPFATLYQIAKRFQTRRRTKSTAQLELPEVKIKVEAEGKVSIRPLPPLHSRVLVTEAMLMTGVAAAQFALKHEIPFPFTTQPPPDPPPPGAPIPDSHPTDLAGMFSYRKKFKPSQMKGSPEPHSGLGLEVYSRATSPLRRYLDLVAHQQLRAFLRKEPLLSTPEMLERLGAAEAVTGNVRRVERFSNQHWTLVFLKQNPNWEGKAILVDRQGTRGTVLLPELALEAKLFLNRDLNLNAEMRVAVTRIDLPELFVHLQCKD